MVADLYGQNLTAHLPSRRNFHHFHAVFRKIWPNNRWAHLPLGVGVPWKIWIRHCLLIYFANSSTASYQNLSKICVNYEWMDSNNISKHVTQKSFLKVNVLSFCDDFCDTVFIFHFVSHRNFPHLFLNGRLTVLTNCDEISILCV